MSIVLLKMILSALLMSSMCVLKLPYSSMLLYLGMSVMSNFIISSRNIVVVVPFVDGGWCRPIRCIGVLYAMVFHTTYSMVGVFPCSSCFVFSDFLCTSAIPPPSSGQACCGFYCVDVLHYL